MPACLQLMFLGRCTAARGQGYGYIVAWHLAGHLYHSHVSVSHKPHLHKDHDPWVGHDAAEHTDMHASRLGQRRHADCRHVAQALLSHGADVSNEEWLSQLLLLTRTGLSHQEEGVGSCGLPGGSFPDGIHLVDSGTDSPAHSNEGTLHDEGIGSSAAIGRDTVGVMGPCLDACMERKHAGGWVPRVHAQQVADWVRYN